MNGTVKVSDFLAELGRRDIHISADGDRLRCNAPTGALTPELRDQLRDLKVEILEFLRTAEAVARQQPAIVPLQPRGARTPVFAVPGHTGDVFCYSDLVRHLGDDQPFFGLQPPGLDGRSEPMARVEDFAAYFAAQIQAFQPDGPYIIGAYCAGGAIAFELARLLQQRGASVSFLALFGCPYPGWYGLLPRMSREGKYWARRIVKHFRAIADLPTFGDRRRYLADRWRARLKTMRENRRPAASDPVLAVRSRVGDLTIAAVCRYIPARYPARMCLFLPNRAWLRTDAAPLRWRTAAPHAETYFGPDTCNDSLMLLEPDAPAFAALFRQCRDGTARGGAP